MSSAIKIGVSGCLAGQAVRYDGAEKRERWVADVLVRYATLVPLCPEVGIGMSVPRPPLRLQGKPRRPRAVGVSDPALDVTDLLHSYANVTAERYGDLAGYIFKSRSPSCGLGSTPVWARVGVSTRGSGLYARTVRRRLALLPAIEDTALADQARRDAFLERAFAYARWQHVGTDYAQLCDFHQRHALILLTRGRRCYRFLNEFLAAARILPPETARAVYGRRFFAVLKRRASRKRHAVVLRDVAARLRHQLDAGERMRLADAINAYAGAINGRELALKTLRELAQRLQNDDLLRQYYVCPCEAEWRLRYDRAWSSGAQNQANLVA